MRNTSIASALVCCILVSACGPSVYGPRRLITWEGIDNPGKLKCPADPTSLSQSLALTIEFYNRACESLRNPTDADFARQMVDAGITLNQARCNDFFAQRAANQTRERLARRAIAPLSALLTGILGIWNFKTAEGRQEATQILALGENATIAGLELYESEFLFGAANINSVRLLTMSKLEDDAEDILARDLTFYAASRLLIRHQMVCTPANILDLAQQAIRNETIATAEPIERSWAARDAAAIAQIRAGLGAANLNADQLGSLWWLSRLVAARATGNQSHLAVLNARLKGLPVNPIRQVNNEFSVDEEFLTPYSRILETLSPEVTAQFATVRRLIEAAAQGTAPPSLLERTAPMTFKLPPGRIAAPQPAAGAR